MAEKLLQTRGDNPDTLEDFLRMRNDLSLWEMGIVCSRFCQQLVRGDLECGGQAAQEITSELSDQIDKLRRKDQSIQ